MNTDQLTCNYARNPLGVETPFPIFNWSIDSDGHDEVQTAYRIVVASNAEGLEAGGGDMWDSGEVSSDQSCGVRYAGKQLSSARRYWWKVRVKGTDGRWSPWSEPAWFEMGLLKDTDWTARWICAPGPNANGLPDTPRPAPFFRKTVHLARDPVSVRAYVSGLGYYELYVNGGKCGDSVLAPTPSHYDRSVYYDTHEVTSQFRTGENVIGVVLGNGWYNTFTRDVWDFHKAAWRHLPKLLLQLEITYAGGRKDIVSTDSSWKVHEGPIVFDGLKNGERYDARLEPVGWNLPGYEDRQWNNAQIARSPGGSLKSAQLPAIKEIEELEAVSVVELDPGTHVFDFGKNISGWGKLKIAAPSGSEVILKYGERLNGDGTLDTTDIDLYIKSGEFQTDRYTAKGEDTETWHPRFTYHGFQYIQTAGLPRGAGADSLHAVVVHTALPDAGSFQCSNALLNTIQECARRSTLTNYHGFPTDCPHREKNGWTGDAVLSAEQVLLNFDPVTAYRKWLLDCVDVQRPSGQIPGIVPSGGWGYNWGSGPAWDSALILIPWYIYVYSADRGILETTYDAMVRYLRFLDSMESDGMVDFGLGDWCPPAEEPSGHKCPAALTDTACAYVDYLTVSRIAEVLGRREDGRRFAEKASKTRASFRDAFVDGKTGSVAGDSQTSLACALYQGLVDDNERQMVLRRLIKEVEMRDRHLDTGILGTKYLLHTLSRHGRTDLAYAIATQTDYPSWGYWIEQGATTLWERWDGKASRNHHMFSDISAWFYRELAGLKPDAGEPGFKHTVFKPNPVAGLSWVKAHHVCPHGRVESEWSVESDRFRLHIQVPVNCRGTVYLPIQFSREVRMNGVRVSPSGRHKLRVGSGSYELIATRS